MEWISLVQRSELLAQSDIADKESVEVESGLSGFESQPLSFFGLSSPNMRCEQDIDTE